MRAKIKSAALRAFPDLALRLFSARSRRIIEAQARQLGLDQLARQVSQACGGQVAKGPFQGMRLDYDVLPVHGAPKFLGTYEQELHSIIERIIALQPRYVLNVGCAEGYYTVGLAARLPTATVFTADADPKALKATLHNAAINDVLSRVHAVGILKPTSFASYLKAPGSVVLMDCEGAEFVLLNPQADGVLLQSHILVEVHPEFGTEEELSSRFWRTHTIMSISPQDRCPSDAPLVVVGSGINVLQALNERTGKKSWLYLEAIGR
jgi:hypothetical protein